MCSQFEQHEAPDQASNHGDAQDTLISISEMLEENAIKLRYERRGITDLLRMGFAPHIRGLDPEQELGAAINNWEPGASSRERWTPHHTV